MSKGKGFMQKSESNSMQCSARICAGVPCKSKGMKMADAGCMVRHYLVLAKGRSTGPTCMDIGRNVIVVNSIRAFGPFRQYQSILQSAGAK